ncbi:MAG TPA: type II secretion system protein [Methylomirabilota bacterium]|jgi:prepilin-type N-terminal cleavage/methylation domain-containing protein|nr:type II secretion system protein [Methylomirabilota bacterium]
MMRPGPRSRDRARRGQAGFSLVEIAIVLVVLAIVGSVLYAYLGSTGKTLEQIREERPLSQARLAADRATITSIRASLQIYYTQNGQWPPTKDAVAALLQPPPNFQCEGNDYTYDPATGLVALVNDDPARC